MVGMRLILYMKWKHLWKLMKMLTQAYNIKVLPFSVLQKKKNKGHK